MAQCNTYKENFRVWFAALNNQTLEYRKIYTHFGLGLTIEAIDKKNASSTTKLTP